MGFDYRFRFADSGWYTANRQQIADRIRDLPHFEEELPPDEFRLRDDTVAPSWSYDMRIFVDDDGVAVEVSAATSTWQVDLPELVRWLRHQTSVELLDDDGSPVAV